MVAILSSEATRSTVRRALARVGLDLRRHDPMRAVSPTRSAMVNRGGVDVVLDVGANGGQYAADLRDWGYRGRILSFEPSSEAFRRLEATSAGDERWECFQLGLGREATQAQLHLAANEGQSSSLLEMSELHVEAAPYATVVGSETVAIDTLDAVWERHVDPEAELFTKIDVQGSELEVLAAGDAVLERSRGLELEMSLLPLYREMGLIGEVVETLRGKGFYLCSIEPAWKAEGSGEILQLNGLFARRA